MAQAPFAAAGLLALVAAGCAGAPPAAPASSAPAEEPKVSLDWLRNRPYVSPWGPDRPLARRKPSWFCLTRLERPESSYCLPTEGECRAAAGPGSKEPCEPHALAACVMASGACYPTMAICEAARRGIPYAQLPDRSPPARNGEGCAYRGGREVVQ